MFLQTLFNKILDLEYFPEANIFMERRLYRIVGEPKSRIWQNDKKIAPDFDMAEFLYIGRLNSAWYGTTV